MSKYTSKGWQVITAVENHSLISICQYILLHCRMPILAASSSDPPRDAVLLESIFS